MSYKHLKIYLLEKSLKTFLNCECVLQLTGDIVARDFSLPKPVANGDIIEIKIISVGARGDGIAKKDDFVIFVKNAQKDEVCKVKITSVRNTYATAEKV